MVSAASLLDILKARSLMSIQTLNVSTSELPVIITLYPDDLVIVSIKENFPVTGAGYVFIGYG